MNSARLIIPLARRHWGKITVGLAALLTVDLLQLCVPRVIKLAVDDLTLGVANGGSLLVQAGVVAALALGMALLRMLWRPLLMGFGRITETKLRQDLFEKFQIMHLGYLAEKPPGELMARATNDLNNIRMAMGIGVVAVVDGILLGAASLGFMVYISPLLALLALLPMPLIIYFSRLQSGRLHRGYLEVQESFAEMTEQVRETFAGMKLVKAYDLAGPRQQRLAASGREYLRINMILARLLALFYPLMLFFTNLSLAIVLGAGGPLTVFGGITAGDFVAFTTYLAMLTWPMMALGWMISLMQRAKVSLDRVAEVLDAEPGIKDPDHPAHLPHDHSGLEIRGLSFTYPGAAAPTLRDISLRVPADGAVALVGRVGSGKSTLLALLGRLYDPPRGAILVEGVDVLDLTQHELRGHVVQVPQEAFLFSATVRENLALAMPDVADGPLWQALEQAELASEIRELPKGLDTMLDEKGLNLSGGQRQRLTLARALLADPPVLLLDDPLSAVDTDTERRILGNLAERRQGKTTLIVSHRLASVTFAGRIYVLDRGRVAESGAHQDLLHAGGIYQSLFAEQSLMAQVEG